MKLLGRHKTLISWLIVGVTAYFFAKALYQNWENIGDVNLAPDWLIGVAIALYVLSIISSGILWGQITSRLVHEKISAKEATRVHLASWLLKYIPGQAGSLLNKLAWGKDRGFDGKKVTASFIYENVFLVLASTVPTIPILLIALGNKFSEGGALFLPLLIVAPFVVIILTPKYFTKAINFLFKLIKKQQVPKDEMLNSRDNFMFFVKFIIPRMINAAAFVFITESLIGIPTSQYLIFSAIYVLAGITGVLAIFVPSGLGVREAVIVLFASAYIPTEQAIVLALVARFYATISDIFVFGLYWWLKRTAGKTK